MLCLALALPALALPQDTAIRSSQMALGDERGDPQPVDLADLASSGARYNRVNVRVRARLDYFPPDTRYLLLVEGGARVLVIPIEEDARELSPLLGLEVEMVGLARELKPPQEDWCRRGHWSLCDEPRLPRLPDLTTDRTTWPQVSITSFRVSDVSPSTGRKAEWPLVSLAALVTAEGKRDDQTVRVLGRFRGKNLFGDLPAGSRRSRVDWVIKDDLHAAWVVDKPSKGKGWSLDGSDKSEAGRWVEVVGRPETVRGVTYLHAQKVNLATAPSSESPAATTLTREAVSPPPPVPPRIMFVMPLGGDEAIAPESRFVLQFTKDMEEGTFAGRVQLRYKGSAQPGDRSFEGMRLDYDPGRRALTIDPGDVLRGGRDVELRLLPGIRDIEGLELIPRADVEGEVGEILAFRVSGR